MLPQAELSALTEIEVKRAEAAAVLAARRNPPAVAPEPQAARGPGADLRFQVGSIPLIADVVAAKPSATAAAPAAAVVIVAVIVAAAAAIVASRKQAHNSILVTIVNEASVAAAMNGT